MSYTEAKEKYAKIGVDTDKAIEILKTVPVSLHCWQGDDVVGFDKRAHFRAVFKPQATIRAELEHPTSLWRILIRLSALCRAK